MKAKDVPPSALAAPSTPVIMKQVPDWDAMYWLLVAKGYLVLECDNFIKTGKSKSVQSVTVKGLNNHVRITRKQQLFTKRIGPTRWFVCL